MTSELEKTKVRSFCVLIYVKGVLGEFGTSNFGEFGVEFCTSLIGVEGARSLGE
jgi:hypothetical protein